MRAPVADQRYALCAEVLLELRERIRHRPGPDHDPLLVITNRREDRSAAVKRCAQELKLRKSGVLKLLEKNDGKCEMQGLQNRWVSPYEQFYKPVNHRKREQHIVLIVVFSLPVHGDGALEFRAFIGDRQSRSGYRTFELIGIHAAEFMRIQKITVILPARHHDPVVRERGSWRNCVVQPVTGFHPS